MLQTARTLGALPALDEHMSWLPVDHAARIILELTGATSASPPPDDTPEIVYHVLNPDLFHWTRDMLPALAAAGLKFETLPTDAWMERFRASERDPERNPPVKLLGWFEGKYGRGAKKGVGGKLVFETGETGKRSEAVGKVPSVLGEEYLGRLVGWLRREWEKECSEMGDG